MRRFELKLYTSLGRCSYRAQWEKKDPCFKGSPSKAAPDIREIGVQLE